MPIRITGMNSGLDTEALVTELVSAYKTKGDKYKKEQTKLSWTQDAWKSLNKKVYSLYKKVSDLRFTSAYNTKKTTVSDPTKATVTAGNNAINGTQTLEISKLAKGGYLTGDQLGTSDGSKTVSSLLPDGMSVTNGTYRISGNGVTKNIEITGDTTINDFVTQINESGTGVKASFDTTNKRLFITSQKTGKDNDFTLAALDEDGAKALYALGVNTKSNTSSAEAAAWLSYATYNDDGSLNESATKSSLESIVEGINDAKKIKAAATTTLNDQTNEMLDNKAAVDYLTALSEKRRAEGLFTGSDEDKAKNAKAMSQLMAMSDTDLAGNYVLDDECNLQKATAEDEADSSKVKYSLAKTTTGEDEDAVTTYELKLNGSTAYTFSTGDDDGKKNVSVLQNYTSNESTIKSYEESASDEESDSFKNRVIRAGGATLEDASRALSDYNNDLETNETNISDAQQTINDQNEFIAQYATLDNDSITDTSMDDSSVSAVVNSLYDKITYFNSNYEEQNGIYVYKNNSLTSTGANKVDGTDAVITLNGVEFTSDTNTFNVNGLTIQAQGVTTGTGEISITTANDTDGIYNKIKDFLSEYNDVINEMTSLYNAESSKGYEPLTSDEKSAMSDKEIEEWENKIKGSLLRRDSTLNSLMSTISSSMSGIFELNGKKYGLSALGIKTAGYFSASANERYALHIDGDEDDDVSSGNADKLKKMLNEDPDTVVNILKEFTSRLYTNLDKKMKSSSMSSAYTIYNDKQMAKNYSNYTTKIKAWDEKVTKIEDSYYKKFSAMETALAKMQSQTSNLTGLFN